MTAPTTAPTGPRRRRRLLLALTLVVAVTIGVGAVLGSRLGQDPTLVDSPLLGRPAPEVTLPLLESAGEVSLRELRGQVVVVNFWASWCVACREEHPALVAVAERYRDSGVTFVGVDYQDQKSSAVEFLDTLGRGGSNYRYVTDPGSRAALDFGLFGVPETFVIDRTGTVAAKITGASTVALLSDVVESVIAGEEPVSRKGGPVQSGPGAPLSEG